MQPTFCSILTSNNHFHFSSVTICRRTNQRFSFTVFEDVRARVDCVCFSVSLEAAARLWLQVWLPREVQRPATHKGHRCVPSLAFRLSDEALQPVPPPTPAHVHVVPRPRYSSQ